MDSADLLRTANLLADYGDPGDPYGDPSEANLRRAVSTAYYAAFHALSQSCADCLAGPDPAPSAREHWVNAYRALDHQQVRKKFSNQRGMATFSGQIRGFALKFVELQDQRHSADYDPDASFNPQEVQQLVKDTQDAVAVFGAASENERRLLAVYLVVTRR